MSHIPKGRSVVQNQRETAAVPRQKKHARDSAPDLCLWDVCLTIDPIAFHSILVLDDLAVAPAPINPCALVAARRSSFRLDCPWDAHSMIPSETHLPVSIKVGGLRVSGRGRRVLETPMYASALPIWA
jgi:hypothetical protein